jgi:hypothetical protein
MDYNSFWVAYHSPSMISCTANRQLTLSITQKEQKEFVTAVPTRSRPCTNAN